MTQYIYPQYHWRIVEKDSFWWLLHNIVAHRLQKDPHSKLTEIALFWTLYTWGGSFIVAVRENEIVGFYENLAVGLWWLAAMCDVAITPEAFVCERHQEKLTWSPKKNKHYNVLWSCGTASVGVTCIVYAN